MCTQHEDRGLRVMSHFPVCGRDTPTSGWPRVSPGPPSCSLSVSEADRALINIPSPSDAYAPPSSRTTVHVQTSHFYMWETELPKVGGTDLRYQPGRGVSPRYPEIQSGIHSNGLRAKGGRKFESSIMTLCAEN